jgi:PAS domain S-box-containing protein
VLIEVSYAPLGMAVFAVGTATVTDKKLHSVSQSWRRQALDDIADAIVLTDAEDRIRYLGSDATEVFSALVDSEGQPFEAVAPELYHLTHDSGSFQWDRDGTTEYYTVVERDLDSSGSQSGTVFAYIDVTESEKARLQLAETEIERQRFQQAIEAVDHSIFMTDIRGTIEYVNPAFEKNTGYDRSTLIGRSPAILNAPDAPNAYPDDLWEQIQQTNGRETEVIQQRQDGTTYYTQQTITPINPQDGATTSYVVILTDITELKQHQQHLEVLSRVLRHNLRNDMNIARGYAETMDSDAAVSDENYTANIITTANDVITLAEQSTTITDLIIDPPECQEVNLSDIARQTTERISETYTQASIEINCQETPPVQAIPQVRTAIEELINNAIIHSAGDNVSIDDEFNRDTTVTHTGDDESIQSLSLVSLPRSSDVAEAQVSITVERLPTENEVVVRVEDENQPIPGMDRQILQRGTEIRSVYHGSGLGLWLVYWVVMRSNGTVDVETRDPRGNRIEMRFKQC